MKKDWKTTLAGLLIGLPTLIDALLTAYTSGSFEGKNTLQLAGSIAIILIGWIMKDPKSKSDRLIGGRPSGRR